MADYASKGVAGAGLGLGIAGTALGLLSGGLGNIGRINGGATTDININAPDVEVARFRRYGFVDHYELTLVRENAELKSQLYAKNEVDVLRKEFEEYKLGIERRFAYDERLIAENKCEIEKTNANLKYNYIKAHKVLSPDDICPQPWNEPASVTISKNSKSVA